MAGTSLAVKFGATSHFSVMSACRLTVGMHQAMDPTEDRVVRQILKETRSRAIPKCVSAVLVSPLKLNPPVDIHCWCSNGAL